MVKCWADRQVRVRADARTAPAGAARAWGDAPVRACVGGVAPAGPPSAASLRCAPLFPEGRASAGACQHLGNLRANTHTAELMRAAWSGPLLNACRQQEAECWSNAGHDEAGPRNGGGGGGGRAEGGETRAKGRSPGVSGAPGVSRGGG